MFKKDTPLVLSFLAFAFIVIAIALFFRRNSVSVAAGQQRVIPAPALVPARAPAPVQMTPSGEQNILNSPHPAAMIEAQSSSEERDSGKDDAYGDVNDYSKMGLHDPEHIGDLHEDRDQETDGVDGNDGAD